MAVGERSKRARDGRNDHRTNGILSPWRGLLAFGGRFPPLKRVGYFRVSLRDTTGSETPWPA